MKRDYYAYQQAKLSSSLNDLEQAVEALEKAKGKNARDQAKEQMKQAAKKAVDIEPHLAYLWFWAKKEEAEERKGKKEEAVGRKGKKKEAKRRKNNDEVKRASEIANSIRDAWQESLTADATSQPLNPLNPKIRPTTEQESLTADATSQTLNPLNPEIRPTTEQESLTANTILQALHFTPDSSVITHLPQLSFTLHILFQLEKPYLSKDDRLFHILDNPVRKEKVFQTPMVAATGWKGALRAALWQLGYKEDHEVTIRLLGNPRESDEHQAGRLHFFPTFFDEFDENDLEVINPHDRETGVDARGPILMECVPQGAIGELVLLYVPFGPIEQSEEERRAQVAQDLEVLAQGIQAMLTTYGFGAKTSSGFGTAEDQLVEKASSGSGTAEDQLVEKASSGSGTAEDQQVGKGKLAIRAKLAGEATPTAALPEPQQPKPRPEPPETLPVSEYTFDTLSKLPDLARRVAEELRKGGAS